MKRLTKILLGFICACTMLFGGGCGLSNQMDEIFQGNYVEVSEETVRDFVGKTKKVQKGSEFRELAENSGGISNIFRGRFIGISVATIEGKSMYNTKGEYQHIEEVKMLGQTQTVYRNGSFCYITKGKEKTKHKSNDTCNYNDMTVIATLQYCLEVNFEEMENTKFYMDTTQTDYIKIKVVGERKAEIEWIWVYDADYRWIAFYWEGVAGGIHSVESVIPWKGTITPPNDLDSYVFEDK